MDYFQLFKDTAISLGFTGDKITPLLVLALLIAFFLNRQMKPVKCLTVKLETFIIRLCAVLQTGGDLNKLELYKSGSPLRITPKGMLALEEIGFKKAIEEGLGELFKAIDNMSPRSALDVETDCIGLIHYLMTDKNSNVLKGVEDYLYNHPQYNNPEYFKAAGLYLRDKYLEQHKDLLPPK